MRGRPAKYAERLTQGYIDDRIMASAAARTLRLSSRSIMQSSRQLHVVRLLLAALLGALTLAAPAQARTRIINEIACAPASGSATITGRVSGIADAPLQGVLVTAYTRYGDVAGDDFSDSAGAYTINSLAAGDYLIRFRPFNAGYATEWYGDAIDPTGATPVALSPGAIITGIDNMLPQGARLSGRVVDQSAQPLAGIQIAVYDAAGSYVGLASTDATGVYTTNQGLSPGGYRLWLRDFSNTWLSQYRNGRDTLESADPIVVTASLLYAGFDVTMMLAGHVSGLVSDDGGLPLDAVTVLLTGATDSFSAASGPDGRYTVNGLPSGIYTVTASGAGLLSAPQLVTVSAPLTASANLSLTLGGVIQGHVDDGSADVANLQVFVGALDGGAQQYVYTDLSGVYTATGLSAGAYTVSFLPAQYVPQTFDNQSDRAHGSPVTVTLGLTVTGIDATLRAGGAISGTLTDAGNGLPIGVSGVRIEVFDAQGARVASVFSAADGSWQTGATLPDGVYTVRFIPFGDACNYVGAYYNGKTGAAAADGVMVSAPNVSPASAALARGSVVFGQAREAGSHALIPGGVARIYDADGQQVAQADVSATGGYHTPIALPPGVYRARYSPAAGGGYLETYYTEALTLTAATPFTLTAGLDVSGIDFLARPPIMRKALLPMVLR